MNVLLEYFNVLAVRYGVIKKFTVILLLYRAVSRQAPINIQHHSERESKIWKEWCKTISEE